MSKDAGVVSSESGEILATVLKKNQYLRDRISKTNKDFKLFLGLLCVFIVGGAVWLANYGILNSSKEYKGVEVAVNEVAALPASPEKHSYLNYVEGAFADGKLTVFENTVINNKYHAAIRDKRAAEHISSANAIAVAAKNANS